MNDSAVHSPPDGAAALGSFIFLLAASGGDVRASLAAVLGRPELTIAYEPRGCRVLRNVREPVDLFAAVGTGDRADGSLLRDPVCRMIGSRSSAAAVVSRSARVRGQS